MVEADRVAPLVADPSTANSTNDTEPNLDGCLFVWESLGSPLEEPWLGHKLLTVIFIFFTKKYFQLQFLKLLVFSGRSL